MSRPDTTGDPATEARVAVRVEHVSKRYGGGSALSRLARGDRPVTEALRDVSLVVPSGASLGIVGESGSGKTTLLRALVGLVTPDSGTVIVDGIDISCAREGMLRQVRRRIQLIYQDPYTSLNPALPVWKAIAEPAVAHGLIPKRDARSRSLDLMGQVGLGSQLLARKPRDLSGGQRQRIAIARALAAEPTILLADEAVSALDVSVQAQVVDLLARLRAELGLTLIFVSHQLATIGGLCDSVAIMYRGEIIERGATKSVFLNPVHEYTAALLRAHPALVRTTPNPPAGSAQAHAARAVQTPSSAA